MAGDDLESDDEYLDQNWGKNEAVNVVVDDTTDNQEKRNKRQYDDVDDNNDSNDDVDEGITSKKNKKMNPKNLILEAGRGIANESPNIQSQFLWACFTNALKLRGEDIPEYKFDSTNFATQPKQQQNESESSKKYDPSMSKFLKSGILSSAKRLKKWKHNKSPMVLIICASAKRAVSILKEISSLNVRAAKLFAKHMSVADQKAMLENNKYSIGVGTPNRLLKLVETNNEDEENNDEIVDAPLSLDETELIVIDCFEDQKRFTVCTMNDTAPDLMKFIKEAVIPQFERRKTLKIALF